MPDQHRLQLLNEYADKARALQSSVEQLKVLNDSGEAFILALEESGRAHRACEQARLKLAKYIAAPYLNLSTK